MVVAYITFAVCACQVHKWSAFFLLCMSAGGRPSWVSWWWILLRCLTPACFQLSILPPYLPWDYLRSSALGIACLLFVLFFLWFGEASNTFLRMSTSWWSHLVYLPYLRSVATQVVVTFSRSLLRHLSYFTFGEAGTVQHLCLGTSTWLVIPARLVAAYPHLQVLFPAAESNRLGCPKQLAGIDVWS